MPASFSSLIFFCTSNDNIGSVSYTHLDVYKRQDIGSSYRTSRIGIFFFGNLKSLQGKIERIAGFIQDGFPHQYGRVITVTTNHFAGILMNQLPEFRVFEMCIRDRYWAATGSTQATSIHADNTFLMLFILLNLN